jgi:threonine/homoserine efflux transporter RhtA
MKAHPRHRVIGDLLLVDMHHSVRNADPMSKAFAAGNRQCCWQFLMKTANSAGVKAGGQE